MKKETTLDVLARMMAEGFAEMGRKINEVRDELKNDIRRVESEVQITNQRIDTIVIPVIDDHSRRIKDLELAGA